MSLSESFPTESQTESQDCDVRLWRVRLHYSRAMGLLLAGETMYWEDRASWEEYAV